MNATILGKLTAIRNVQVEAATGWVHEPSDYYRMYRQHGIMFALQLSRIAEGTKRSTAQWTKLGGASKASKVEETANTWSADSVTANARYLAALD